MIPREAVTLPRTILDCIGNTTLMPLRRMVPKGSARVLLKLESENPTGSMKDRMALAMIEAAEAGGRLQPGGSVVEYTTGNTGMALSLICAVKGYPLDIVTSDAYSKSKADHMRILGARLRVLPSEQGRMTEQLTKSMVAAAAGIANETGAFWANQLSNADQIPAYHRMGEEILRQTNGEVDAFVQAVGTAACFRGVGEFLKANRPDILLAAVEPAESAVLSGGRPGGHRIDGIGAGYIVPLWKEGLAARIETVSSDDAFRTALRLAREEGIFGGSTTGANVAAALRIASDLGSNATVVSVMCDTGLKYLDTFGAILSRGRQ
ncbi:MAG: PLP-dependent cysteine synthase family protein [Bryobacteraceae bacterium]|nr:PLP-dependent cysteine synthase family protein [Bryobacteraceae bacterium]